MNCREYQHQIVLFLYEELPDAEKAGLEAHLHQCAGCQQALEEQKSLHLAIGEDAASWEAPFDLLVESRQALADELDRLEQKRAWWRIPTFSVVFTPMRMLESAALVAMGLALGVYVTKQQVPASLVSSTVPESASISIIPRNATVSNLRIVDANTRTGEVELAGEVVQPLRMQGNMDDDTVRRLLLSALSDVANPHSRLHAVEMLSKKPGDGSVREVLIHVLESDENSGVRQIALESLIPFAGERDVQTAFIYALKNDKNEGIRTQIIDALKRFAGNELVAKSVEEVTKDDDNPYLRAKGLQFVGNHQ